MGWPASWVIGRHAMEILDSEVEETAATNLAEPPVESHWSAGS